MTREDEMLKVRTEAFYIKGLMLGFDIKTITENIWGNTFDKYHMVKGLDFANTEYDYFEKISKQPVAPKSIRFYEDLLTTKHPSGLIVDPDCKTKQLVKSSFTLSGFHNDCYRIIEFNPGMRRTNVLEYYLEGKDIFDVYGYSVNKNDVSNFLLKRTNDELFFNIGNLSITLLIKLNQIPISEMYKQSAETVSVNLKKILGLISTLLGGSVEKENFAIVYNHKAKEYKQLIRHPELKTEAQILNAAFLLVSAIDGRTVNHHNINELHAFYEIHCPKCKSLCDRDYLTKKGICTSCYADEHGASHY